MERRTGELQHNVTPAEWELNGIWNYLFKHTSVKAHYIRLGILHSFRHTHLFRHTTSLKAHYIRLGTLHLFKHATSV
jgi:hypothetical protein